MMTHATIDRVQKYTTPTRSGGGAMLALDATVFDGEGPRIARISVHIGEGIVAHAIADALVKAINDGLQEDAP